MRIAFFSTMAGMPWGGSEELWSRAAHVLLERGHYVGVNFKRRKQHKQIPPLMRLQDAGADLYWRRALRVGRTMRKLLAAVRVGQNPSLKWLKHARPDLLVISVGYHLDELAITQTCRSLGIPYVLLVQAASPYQWLEPHRFEAQRAAYAGAAQCFFVSHQNREVLESNLALDLSDAAIVDNPFQVNVGAAPPWPTTEKVWKLACVARIHFQSKAQDLLLRVMRQAKWRARPVQVCLWGADGGSLQQLKELIALHSQHKQVQVKGFADNIEQLWSEHHALVLPSRFEGNALAMIEAMLCGRVPIVTNVGRVSELVDDGRNGFVAPAATFELVDDVLERAWQRRHEWQAMGQLAARDLRQRHSLRPAEDFADAILDATPGQQTTSHLRAAA
jgi:glycosyltransferase involved in cell wall biosynthesis